MRKIVIGLSSLIIIGFIVIIVLSLRKNVNEEINVYAIPKSYCYKYKEDRRMYFEVYINDDESLITLEDENSYRLVVGSSSFLLTNVEVDVEYNCVYDNEDYYKYTIVSDILNFSNVNIKECYLEISNNKYTVLVNIGSFKIISNDFKELVFSELYGNYTYINEELYLTGITITLDQGYHKIYSMTIGDGFGNLDYIEKDVYKDAEIDIGNIVHPIIDNKKIYDGIELDANYNTYFIPVSYLNYALITNSPVFLNIDHKSYYIDNFQFLISNISFISYESILTKGEVIYA